MPDSQVPDWEKVRQRFCVRKLRWRQRCFQQMSNHIRRQSRRLNNNTMIWKSSHRRTWKLRLRYLLRLYGFLNRLRIAMTALQTPLELAHLRWTRFVKDWSSSVSMGSICPHCPSVYSTASRFLGPFVRVERWISVPSIQCDWTVLLSQGSGCTMEECNRGPMITNHCSFRYLTLRS
jgi:hypothetical protein